MAGQKSYAAVASTGSSQGQSSQQAPTQEVGHGHGQGSGQGQSAMDMSTKQQPADAPPPCEWCIPEFIDSVLEVKRNRGYVPPVSM
jgi:hypothetical protein